MTDFTQIYERHTEALATANAHNKIVVFAALAAAGITSVNVSFDGEGDSGQITDITAFAGEKHMKLPQTAIAIQRASWGREGLIDCEQPFSEAIEALCYGYLEQQNSGWENNDGAYGEFTFDVGKRSIELDFNARYVDVYNSIYSL